MPTKWGYDYLGISYQRKESATRRFSPTMVFGNVAHICVPHSRRALRKLVAAFSVLLGTPVAVLGAFLTLWLRGMENNIYAQIGLIMPHRIGGERTPFSSSISPRTNTKRANRCSKPPGRRAVAFAPNLDDFLCIYFRMLPLWFASGSGAVARRILGSTVIGGMIALPRSPFSYPVRFMSSNDSFAGRKRKNGSESHCAARRCLQSKLRPVAICRPPACAGPANVALHSGKRPTGPWLQQV